MTGVSDYSADALLEWITGKTAMPSKPTAYVALFTAVGSDDGTGFTEVSGNGYTRAVTAGADWNSASGTSPSLISNVNTISFPASTGAGWGTVIAFGLYDASTSGNLLFWDYLGPFNWLPTTVSLASPGVLTSKAHGYSASDTFVFTTEYGGTSPTFSQGNFTGLLTVGPTPATDTFTALTGATAVNTSSTGDGMVRKVTQQPIPGGVTASFAGGSPGVLQLNMA
jgi:hypothetical protein